MRVGVMTALALVLMCLFLFACSSGGNTSTAEPGLGSLKVLVMNSQHQPLSGGKVVSNEQPAGQLKVTGLTGADGSVTFQGIKAGSYQFYVSRFDYEQAEFSASVVSGQTLQKTVTLNAVGSGTSATTSAP